MSSRGSLLRRGAPGTLRVPPYSSFAVAYDPAARQGELPPPAPGVRGAGVPVPAPVPLGRRRRNRNRAVRLLPEPAMGHPGLRGGQRAGDAPRGGADLRRTPRPPFVPGPAPPPAALPGGPGDGQFGRAQSPRQRRGPADRVAADPRRPSPGRPSGLRLRHPVRTARRIPEVRAQRVQRRARGHPADPVGPRAAAARRSGAGGWAGRTRLDGGTASGARVHPCRDVRGPDRRRLPHPGRA